MPTYRVQIVGVGNVTIETEPHEEMDLTPKQVTERVLYLAGVTVERISE